ncbi:hypothetical protein BpHYR1_002786, partial [Brachionus plicatilis]
SNLSLYDTVDDQVEDDDYYDPELCFENENDDKVVEEYEEEESIEPKKKLTATSTKFGNPKLCHEGYFYTINRQTGVFPNNKIEWKCERVGSKKDKCNGRVVTIGHLEPVKEITSHNHLPDPAKTECLLAMEKLKQLAQQSSQNPRSIIKKAQLNLSEESAAKMTRAVYLTQIVKRIQNEKVDSGDTAKDRTELNIPDSLLLSYDGEKFLLEDTGPDDPERILIFCTKENLTLLNSNWDWYCDGT